MDILNPTASAWSGGASLTPAPVPVPVPDGMLEKLEEARAHMADGQYQAAMSAILKASTHGFLRVVLRNSLLTFVVG